MERHFLTFWLWLITSSGAICAVIGLIFNTLWVSIVGLIVMTMPILIIAIFVRCTERAVDDFPLKSHNDVYANSYTPF